MKIEKNENNRLFTNPGESVYKSIWSKFIRKL